jgi:hypothetical protein
MAREIKSILFNLEDGKDVRRHRDHRSKKGRNRWNRDTTFAYLKKKREKEELSTDWKVKNLFY